MIFTLAVLRAVHHIFTYTMKTLLLLLSVLTLICVNATAADTNLNQSITVQRPLDDVIEAMHTYYFSTNYHGFEHAVYSTNAVPGMSYSYKIADCAFSGVGPLGGDMVATRISASSTKLELRVDNSTPQDPRAAATYKKAISRNLDRIAKIAQDKR